MPASRMSSGTARDAMRGSLRDSLGFAFRFAEASNAIALLPLATLFEQLQALKTFEDVSLAAQSGGRSQTAMLRHILS